MPETQFLPGFEPEPIAHHGYPKGHGRQPEPKTNPKTLARSNDRETSKEAASQIAKDITRQESMVLRWLADWEANHLGFPPTTWELAADADPSYTGNPRSTVRMIEPIIRRRMSALVNKEKVEEGDSRQNMTEHSTRKMTTWRLSKGK